MYELGIIPVIPVRGFIAIIFFNFLHFYPQNLVMRST